MLDGEKTPEVSLEDHCSYRYLFNYRGVAASFRLKHLFLCKSLVFHVGKDWTEFFYPLLEPWYHYIPVDSNASEEELESLIEFAKHHQDIMEKIALNGYELIRDRLRMEDVECYWSGLLNEYAKKIDFKVKLREGMVEI